MIRIRNLTGRDVVIYDDNNNPTDNRFPSEGEPQSRISGPSGGVVIDTVQGVPIVDVALNQVNLPEREKDTFLITNRITAEAAMVQGRRTDDLLIPQCPVRLNLTTNQIITKDNAVTDDGNNEIIGWQRLARLPK